MVWWLHQASETHLQLASGYNKIFHVCLLCLQEDIPVADSNVLCLLHLPEQQCIISGCEDGNIKLHYLDGRAASSSDGGQLPMVLTGHTGKVTGLAALPGDLLLSCSEDRSLRLWDLKTMKQLHVSKEEQQAMQRVQNPVGHGRVFCLLPATPTEFLDGCCYVTHLCCFWHVIIHGYIRLLSGPGSACPRPERWRSMQMTVVQRCVPLKYICERLISLACGASLHTLHYAE